jgi:hypothetical protein
MKSPLLVQAKGQLTREQKKEIRAEIVNYYSGIDGGHGALLMQGGVEIKPLTVNPKDIDFINGKKLNREEILAVFGVPPAMVGIFEYANYCLKIDSKVLLKNNQIKKIQDVEPGDVVLSLGQHSVVEAKVVNCWEAGYKHVCTLQTKLRKIECSLEHRFLRKIPALDSENVVMEWIQASELRLNDEIAIVFKESDINEENIHFSRNLKSDFLPHGLMWDKVKSISVAEEQAEMFDLEIEGTHNYFANWMVTHNSNVREQIRIFWEHTLLPKMNYILELVQFNILDRDFPGVYAEWDLSGVAGLAPDPIEIATPAKTYRDMGYSPSQISRILNYPELEPDKDFKEPQQPQAPAQQPQQTPKKPPKDPGAGDPKPSDKPKPDNNNTLSVKNDLIKQIRLFAQYVPLENGSRSVLKLWEDLIEQFLLKKFEGIDLLPCRSLPQLLIKNPTEDMRREFSNGAEKIAEVLVSSIYNVHSRL